MDTAALGLTLRLASITTLCLLLLATPLALWLAAGSKRASGSGILRRIIQATVALPLVLPPTVLGFYLLVGLGPNTALGRSLIALFGHTLAFTFPGLVLGSILYSLPFTVQPLVVGFSSVDRAITETASVLGASPWRVFWRIVFPLSRMSFLSAIVLTFAHTVGEFGVVLMLGGDIPGVTRTLSISIYDLVQETRYSAANTTALTLIAFSFLALLLLYGRPSHRRSDLA